MKATLSFVLACLITAGPILQNVTAQDDRDRLVRSTDPLPPEEEQALLHVPDGFTARIFASEPMIHKPINLAFDARGRMWVSSTVEYPYAANRERWADDQGSSVRDSRDAIKILEDTDGDGRADRVTDFADGLNIPTGVVPWHKPEHRDGCIAWSIPNIWYVADTDGDGKADLREVLFGPLGYEKDTHGMCSSFRSGSDGWIYATHGFNNTSHLKARDGSTLDLHSGNVFRFRPDGSRVEIWSWGQVNPFGLCWDRRGNLYSADCHSNPITQLLRGATYQSFGKPHDGLGFAPIMCTHQHGSTGLCGIVYIDGGIWGPEWDDHMLVGNCVTSRINHDHITFAGTTPTANEALDFLVSDDPWFRPVDLQLGPDNALYIADFYNRIIGHYEVPLDHPGRDRERGRIWRIVKDGASSAPRPAPPAPDPATLADLAAANPFAKRAAAAWFSEHPDPAALPVLLEQVAAAPEADAQLRHQLRITIRDTLAAPDGYAAASSLNPEDRVIIRDLSLAVPTAAAAEYLARAWQDGTTPHPAPAVLTHLVRRGSPETVEQTVANARVTCPGTSDEAMAAVSAIHAGLLERGGPPPASFLSWANDLAETLFTASKTLQREWEPVPHPDFPQGPTPWCLQERSCADGLTATVLSSLDGRQKSREQLTGVLRSQPFPAPKTLSFWLCGHRGFPNEPAHDRNLVRLVLVSGGETVEETFPPRNDVCQPVAWDLTAVEDQPVRLEIVDGDNGRAYAWLGITRIDPAVVDIQSFGQADRVRQHLATLAGILRTTAPVSLRDRLAAFLPASSAAPAPSAPRPELDALIADRRTRFSNAIPDPEKGQAVFSATCAACHQIQGQGGLIGPQLDGIGQRGTDRLIEDILDPNRNIDTHFRLHQLGLRGGTTVAGFVRGEVGQVLILVDATGQEQRIAKGDILADTELPVSLMPPNFGDLVDPESFNDLVAWLLKR